MIWVWAFQAIGALVVGVLSIMPTINPPAWLTADSGLGTVLGYFAGLGAWIPLGLLMMVFGAVITCVAVGFGIKAVRIALSYGTAGGGSAG